MELSDDKLIAMVEMYESSSYGINDSELSANRADAIDRYNGELYGDELPDRSQVISRDVLDTIESALPQLLKVFVSGDEVMRFTPRNGDDEKKAEQETAAVNYWVMEKNDGFGILYTAFKDALLSKNSYGKVWYEENEESEDETYKGLTDEQLSMLVQDEKVEVLEHTETPDEIDNQQRQEAIQQIQGQIQQAMQAAQAGDQQAGQAVKQMTQQLQQIGSMPAKMLHDVKIKVTEVRGCIKIDNVAPEDMLIGQDTKTVSLQNANFVQHRATMDEAEIKEQGWEVPENGMYSDDSSLHEEAQARDLYNEQQGLQTLTRYQVKDTYIRVDGDLMRLVIIGNVIVFREDAEVMPFFCLTPHVMPHRHIGLSYADLTKDIQLMKTTLLRGQLDAMYLANQPRFAVSDRVNLSDMLVSRPGGIVRVTGEPGSSIMNLQANAIPNSSFTLVEYLDSAKERRTGITSYNQGLDANSLNKTATGVSQIMQATQQRVELVARTFANQLKDLFMLVHHLVRTCYTRPEIIRLRDEWVEVDPREWKERKDMAISVGLGTGNKDQQLMHLQNILMQQMQMLQMGLPVVTPQNVYETMRQLVMNAGFKQPELFVSDPTKAAPKPPQQDPQLQIEQMKLQAKQQADQQAAQLDIQKFQAQAEIDKRQAEQAIQQEQLRSQNDVAIEREKIQAQAELERYKAELDAQTKILIAQYQAENDAANELKQHRSELGGMVEKMKGAQGNDQMAAVMQGLQTLAESLNRPKQIVRGPDGRAQGIQ